MGLGCLLGQDIKETNMRKSPLFRTGRFSGGLILTFALLTGFSATYAEARQKAASMAIDAHTGRILHSHNIDKPHYPASLTKVMTIYMLFEFLKAGRMDLDSKLIVTENAAAQAPSKLGLKPGSSIRVEDAIRALITKSANDVAVTVAENLAGSEWKFAQLMTWKARSLGMKNTVFKNASGLPNNRQITTARDMIKLAMRIQKDFPEYYPIFSTKYYSHGPKRYKNYNRLLFRMKGVDGIKTGYTRASGFNLTSSVWQGRKHVVAVVLGGKTSRKRDNYMIRLLRKSLRKASNGQRKKHYVLARRPVKKAAPKPVIVQKKVAEPIVVASARAKAPEGISKLGAALPAPGPYHIQIGAFSTKDDALARLESIGSKAGSILKGHKSFTMAVPNSEIHRARFAGFTEFQAKRACNLLKKRSIDCLAVPAN